MKWLPSNILTNLAARTRAIVARLLSRWRQKEIVTAPLSPPQLQPPPPLSAPSEPPTLTPTGANRHERRVAERARRRHDKFVQPKGPLPVKKVRSEPLPPRPKPVAVEPEPQDAKPSTDPNDKPIIGEWIDGDGEDVLYEESEIYGEFNFRDTILDQLDRYWVYLERMRKHDPEAYGFYKQVGATLVPYVATGSFTDKARQLETISDMEKYKSQIKLTPWFRQVWPSFGCVAYGTNPRDEASERAKTPTGSRVIQPKFLFFRRVNRHDWMVQPVRGGKNYMVTVWWDNAYDKRKWGIPQEIPFNISDDGTKIRPLKVRERVNGETTAWWDWRIPGQYRKWSKMYHISPQVHLAHLFCECTRDVESASYSVLRVEVSKDDLTAVFGLSPRRTPYFFQDRDIVLNEHGVKKRIFHMVRPHVRADGTKVPTHFRGLREFTWAGYKIWISVPGRDHFMPLEFNVPMTYVARKGEKYFTESEYGKTLKEQMHSHLGGENRRKA